MLASKNLSSQSLDKKNISSQNKILTMASESYGKRIMLLESGHNEHQQKLVNYEEQYSTIEKQIHLLQKKLDAEKEYYRNLEACIEEVETVYSEFKSQSFFTQIRCYSNKTAIQDKIKKFQKELMLQGTYINKIESDIQVLKKNLRLIAHFMSVVESHIQTNHESLIFRTQEYQNAHKTYQKILHTAHIPNINPISNVIKNKPKKSTSH